MLQVIWYNLPRGPIDKSVKNFTERLSERAKADGGQFEYPQ